MSRVLCFDPSGNFSEGKGTTGYAVFENDELVTFGDVAAKDFETREEYWSWITKVIYDVQPTLCIIEDYHLFEFKSKQQSWSALETPQLIGYMRMFCYNHDIPYRFQSPKDKVRVNDDQLVKLGIIEKRGNRYYCSGKSTNLHQRDAIRHGIFYHRYRKGK